METSSMLKSIIISVSIVTITSYSLLAQEIFIEHTIDNNFNGACSVCSYDLNLDGNLDIIAAGNDSHQIAWWKAEKDSEITFTKLIVDANATGIIYVDVADVNMDSHPDILGASWQGNEISIWLNDGGEPITWQKVIIDNDITNAHEVHGAYVDADTLIDLIAASGGSHQIIWYRNTGGNPIVWEKNIIDNQFTGARSVACIDMNDDGYNDLIGAALNANQISVWFNSGTNPIQWTKQIVDNNFNGAHWVDIADIDKDMDSDILGAAYAVNQIAWWRNDGGTPIQWEKQIISSTFGGALSVEAADLDLDDDMDVFGAATIANKVNWWDNDGNMPIQWNSNDILNNYYEAWPVFGVDLDNDGDTDVLTTAATAGKVTWLENTTITTGISNEQSNNPDKFYLLQNYPNPFNPSTKIKYSVPRMQSVTLKVFDLLGNEIANLVSEEKPQGIYEVEFNSSDIPSGVYFYSLAGADFYSVKKMMLLK